MKKTTIKSYANASLTLASMLRQRTKKMVVSSAVRAAGLQCEAGEKVGTKTKVSLNVTCRQEDFEAELGDVASDDKLVKLAKGIYSAHISLASAAKLLKLKSVTQVQTKKRSTLHLDNATTDAGLRTEPDAGRVVPETGDGVLIGVVDSGFDLSHPMFRDGAGNLRVKGLLDQTTGQEFTATELENGWNGVSNPDGPGGDDNGHGTHVATIAGGTERSGFEGVAPGARFVLVKTDFINTDEAVKWCFTKAGSKSCVVNLSLGHHWGGHDGTTAAELLYQTLVGRGKIIVASAGNERNDSIHIGSRFVPGQTQSAGFRVLRQPSPTELPFASLTLWYDRDDEFEFALVTPDGQSLPVPSVGSNVGYSNSQVEIELGHLFHAGPTQGKRVQITLSFSSPSVSNNLLNGWTLRATCDTAVIGRLDGWFNNSGFAEFSPGPLVELTRTIGLPATSNGCIAVASHVSSNTWDSDDGPQTDSTVLVGRSSPFSSQGPTRDGRQKPEISAPGQYLTAALAAGSRLAGMDERALTANRLLTIEGTSMSAPMVTGAIALLLQKKPKLTPAQAVQALADSATTDPHTVAVWNPAYGHGKLNIPGALSEI